MIQTSCRAFSVSYYLCSAICLILASFAPHALKGQKLLAQGIALGVIAISKSPCKGKSFINSGILKLLPLQGDRFASVITQGVALG